MENKIEVYYKNKLVGTLANLEGKYAFQYDDEWIKNGFSISPFSLPLKKGLFVPTKKYFNGFYGVFADSLPDAWGRLLLERFLKKKSISNYDGLYRLAAIGNTGMGALEYVPNFSKKLKNTIPDFDEFQKKVNEVLDDNNDINIDYLYKYGGSSGGARPKALIRYNNEEWIVKFQSRFDITNSGFVEYEYALTCKELGMNMPDVKLFESKKTKGYFGIKRFDRVGDEKIHMISAAALLEVDFQTPCCDYSDLFKLTKIVTKDNLNDLKELYLRMCFNVYAHNLDDHVKNFSYIYDEKLKSYRLSPAYDMTYSDTFYGVHTTSVNGKDIDITTDDLVIVGVIAGLKREYCIKVAERVKKTVENNLGKYLSK